MMNECDETRAENTRLQEQINDLIGRAACQAELTKQQLDVAWTLGWRQGVVFERRFARGDIDIDAIPDSPYV